MILPIGSGTYDAKFRVDRYLADNSLAVAVYDPKDGLVAVLTVCLNDKSLANNEAYIDTDNCPWAVNFLARNGLAELTGAQRRRGFCVYPQMRFNLDALMEETDED